MFIKISDNEMVNTDYVVQVTRVVDSTCLMLRGHTKAIVVHDPYFRLWNQLRQPSRP